MRTLSATLFFATLLTAIAAPLKEKEKPLPPPTEKQYADSINHLKQLGLATHNFYDVNNRMPANTIKEKKPTLSWRVHLLPYLEENELYRSFKLDEPWDSDHNMKLIEKIPKVYQPVRGHFKKGETFYQMFNWERGILRPDSASVTFASITDGTSNTFLIVEGGNPVIWTKSDDIPYKSDDEMLPKLGGMFDGHFNAVMADGASYRIPKSLDGETIRRLIEPSDGKLVELQKAIDEAKPK